MKVVTQQLRRSKHTLKAVRVSVRSRIDDHVFALQAHFRLQGYVWCQAPVELWVYSVGKFEELAFGYTFCFKKSSLYHLRDRTNIRSLAVGPRFQRLGESQSKTRLHESERAG